jgi:hypothetical protein
MRAVRVALVAAVMASLAAPSATAHHGKGKHAQPKPSAPASSIVDIRAVHDDTCPRVVQYLTCSSLSVTIFGYGLTGWTASSGPAKGTVEYNSSYTLSASSWAQTAAHEVGGHHDAWAELVTKVGVDQAWMDYYDLDTFGEPWAESRFAALGKPRDLTSHEGKEVYLDCAGPVAHGYSGNYLTNRGIPFADQPAFCVGHESVMTKALG